MPTISVTNQTIAAVEGMSGTFTTATFTDTDPSPVADYTATIDWGDGSPTTAGTISQTGSTFSVMGNHTYADETAPGTPLPVTVHIQENNGTDQDSGTASSTANVAEADVLSGTGATLTATQGQSFTGAVATFTDTNTANSATDFSASIAWGDGTTTAGTVSGSAGNFSVTGMHTYAEDGSFPVSVTLTDNIPGTATATASSTATIAESNDLTATATAITTMEGQAFSGTVASFTDTGSPNPASAFTATINWGDGFTSTGTVTGSAGSFTVAGAHTYADEGSFTVTVQITETGITNGTVSTSATGLVSEADFLSATGTPISATQGQPFTGQVAAFTSTYIGNTATDFAASINWGDGATSFGTVTGSNGSFTVTGAHTYASAGSFPVTITIADDVSGTASVTATTTATVTATFGTTWLDRVYRDLLHRAVDPVGLAGWTSELNRGVSRQFIVDMIEQSVEYRTDEVQSLYQQFLHRPADSFGLNAWVNALGSGMTILQVEGEILGSPEFFQDSGGTNQGFVNALYFDLLHRSPDPGGLSLALGALSQGVSRQAVAAAVLSSDEFHGDLITALYGQFLMRPPDSFGFNLSLQALRTGFSEEALIAVLVGSPEYFASATD